MAKKSKTKLSDMVQPMPYKQTAYDKERERKYRAEDDIRTMQRAEEIRKDKDRVKAMKECAADQIKALQSCAK